LFLLTGFAISGKLQYEYVARINIHTHADFQVPIMVATAEEDELLLLVARLYHVDGFSQGDVARMANVSQAKISRLLAKARQKGIVQISVAEYDPRDYQLEEQLEKRLGLRQATVVKAPEGLPMRELRQSVAHFAAPRVSAMIQSGDVLALAGGRAMQWLVHAMQPPPQFSGLTIVQAMGNIDASVGPYDALELGRIIANRWRGTFLTLNLPALLPNARTRKSFLALAPIQQVVGRLQNVRIALVGVGTLDNSVFVERDALHGDDIEQLKKAGAVGEICGRFYNRSGKECNTPYRDRVVSIELEDLKKADEVVAIVVGSDRTEAIRSALRGGLIKSLVMDQAGAIALLKDAEAKT
jgi:deoxyribonucleoside regulator